MKKMFLFLVALGCVAGAASVSYAENLSDAQILQKIRRTEFLPYMLWTLDNKPAMVKEAQQQIKQYHSYAAHYNAAAVCFADGVNAGGDGPYILSETDVANVVLYATKALELSKGRQAPDMYLLRALARMVPAGLWGGISYPDQEEDMLAWVKNHKKEARVILSDLEKADEINPSETTFLYYEMMLLYKGLGHQEMAVKYQNKYDAHIQQQMLRYQAWKESIASAVSRQVRQASSATKQKARSVSGHLRHPREINGYIWPSK